MRGATCDELPMRRPRRVLGSGFHRLARPSHSAYTAVRSNQRTNLGQSSAKGCCSGLQTSRRAGAGTTRTLLAEAANCLIMGRVAGMREVTDANRGIVPTGGAVLGRNRPRANRRGAGRTGADARPRQRLRAAPCPWTSNRSRNTLMLRRKGGRNWLGARLSWRDGAGNGPRSRKRLRSLPGPRPRQALGQHRSRDLQRRVCPATRMAAPGGAHETCRVRPECTF